MKDTISSGGFRCERCGKCCRNLALFGAAYAWLDNGAGTCRFFEESESLCKIYPIRPLICRIEDGYWLYFSHLDYEKYIEATKTGCRLLQGGA